MKFIPFLIFGCFFFCVSTVHAESEYTVSILGGLTTSTMNDSGTSSFSSIINASSSEQGTPTTTTSSAGTGLILAGLVSKSIAPLFGIEGGLFFLRRTVNFNVVTSSGATFGSNFDLKYNSLILPVMFKVTPPLLGLSAELGGYIGLGASETLEQSDVDTAVNSPPTDKGLIAGLTYSYPVKDHLDLRGSLYYLDSLTDLSNNSSNVKLKSFLFLVGVTLELL